MNGQELKALREKLGLSQSEFARNIYLTPSAVNHMESGKNPVSGQTEALALQLATQLAS